MKTYIPFIAVMVCSFGAAYFLPLEKAWLGVMATPGGLALFGALYQILRDQSAHERKIELQRRQEIFNLGATSHMANVAFDKHVEFCEKYMSEVHDTVTTLYRKGPTELALSHANNFHKMRQKYAAWLTEEINDNLFPFEQALRSLGADQGLINHTNDQDLRSKHIEKVFADFKKILTIERGKEPDPEIATEEVKKKVRKILDIEDLVQLRKRLIEEAKNAVRI